MLSKPSPRTIYRRIFCCSGKPLHLNKKTLHPYQNKINYNYNKQLTEVEFGKVNYSMILTVSFEALLLVLFLLYYQDIRTKLLVGFFFTEKAEHYSKRLISQI